MTPDGEADPVTAERGFRDTLGVLSYELKTRIASVPSIALPIARLRKSGEVIGDDTDIVIESFPRCASSFAVAAFRLAQEPQPMTIANHTHMPAQVLAAARQGTPALVLTREPEDAVLSHVIHTPNVTVAASVRGYVRFYEPLVRVRQAFVLGRFEEVVRDFGSVIVRVNERFGTTFTPFEHTDANLARLNLEIERDYGRRARSPEELELIIPRPSTSREQLKEGLRDHYRRVPDTLRKRAQRVFDRLRSSE
ncbi:MAG: hypothetical protein ACRDHU_08075 [Actinomycetota bacterium]